MGISSRALGLSRSLGPASEAAKMEIRPIVALTGSGGKTKAGWPCAQLDRRYAYAVSRGGGIPILGLEKARLEELASATSGLLLTGGTDISPALYGQSREALTQEPDLDRDTIELDLIDAFMAQGKPILGICRGCQILNARFGGKLWQDIPARFGVDHGGGVRHSIEIEPQTLLSSLFGASAIVNSYHHQAIARLGEGLVSVAKARAGDEWIIEAFSHESYPLLGVQWHPERSLDESEGETGMLKLFRDFMNNCIK